MSQILVDHCNDPDLFSIIGKWQEEHGAIVLTHTGLAPYEAQRFVDMGLMHTQRDLQTLYLSWALHYLEDCGMPFHTTLDPNVQGLPPPSFGWIHFGVESYIDVNISKYEIAMRAATFKDVRNLYQAGWDLAEFVNGYVYILREAYVKGDMATVDDVAKIVLAETVSYVAGAIKNFNALYLQLSVPPSIITAAVFGVPILGIAVAIKSEQKG